MFTDAEARAVEDLELLLEAVMGLTHHGYMLSSMLADKLRHVPPYIRETFEGLEGCVRKESDELFELAESFENAHQRYFPDD